VAAPNAAATWGGGNEANSAEQENFEPGNFRTGFTPGAGTGFTPGYNALLNSNFAGPLPMPSPNTAAFLTSITLPENGGENGAAQSMENRPPPSAIPPHLQPQAHGSVAPPLNPGNGDPSALNALGALAGNMSRAPPPEMQQQPYYPPGMHPGGPGLAPGMPQVDYAQQNANAASQAANGLFLLSQAHQELSKREREEAASSPLGKRGAGPPKATTAGTKRKDTAPPKGNAKKAKKKDGTPESDDDDLEDMKGSRNETEEDKRKNFLERNRQGE
jgi:ATF/CREB family transcription factor